MQQILSARPQLQGAQVDGRLHFSLPDRHAAAAWLHLPCITPWSRYKCAAAGSPAAQTAGSALTCVDVPRALAHGQQRDAGQVGEDVGHHVKLHVQQRRQSLQGRAGGRGAAEQGCQHSLPCSPALENVQSTRAAQRSLWKVPKFSARMAAPWPRSSGHTDQANPPCQLAELAQPSAELAQPPCGTNPCTDPDPEPTRWQAHLSQLNIHHMVHGLAGFVARAAHARQLRLEG